MLDQILGVRQLSYSTFEEIAAQRAIPEGQWIDYKEEIPKLEDLCNDVVAMANAGGGLLVLGVKCEGLLPIEVTPVLLADTEVRFTNVDRIQQSIGNRIHPWVNVEYHPLLASDKGSEGVLVLEIRPGPLTPYAASDRGRLAYYMRSGSHNNLMSEAEVSLLYRDRFYRQTADDQRIAQAEAEINDDLFSETDEQPSAVAYVVVLPLVRNRRFFRPTVAVARSIPQIPRHVRSLTRAQSSFGGGRVDPIFGWDTARIIPADARPGFKHLELSDSFEEGFQASYPRLRFYDDGLIWGTYPLGVNDDSFPEIIVDDVTLMFAVLSQLAASWVLLVNEARYLGDVQVRVGLMRNARSEVTLQGSVNMYQHHQRALARNVWSDAYADVPSLAIGPELLRTAKPLLDDLCTAFGRPECLQVAVDGRLRQRYFRPRHVPMVEAWANMVGAEMTEERVT